MNRKQFSEVQIIGIMEEAEPGAVVTELCRKDSKSSVTYYAWKAKLGGLAARALAKRLKDEDTERDERLDEFKRLYEEKFKCSRHRNLISLFLYSGPVGRRFSLAGLAASHALRLPEAVKRFAQIYTGDGTLKQDYWTRFRNFYRKGKQLEKAGSVQVMHHEAAGNSEVGMATRLRLVASIFSSDPAKRQEHPDAKVLRNLWPYHPTQVDDAKGFRLSALLLMR